MGIVPMEEGQLIKDENRVILMVYKFDVPS